MKQSNENKNIYKAFVLAQCEMKQPKKNATNPFHHSTYATLDELINTVKPILNKNGLAVIQELAGDEGYTSVTTRLIHESGEWIETEPFELKLDKDTPQGAGAGATYGRRYSLSALLNVASEEDDDGNSNEKLKTPPKTNPKPPSGVISEKQVKRLHTLAGIKTDMARTIIRKYGYESSKDIKIIDYDKICNEIGEDK